MWMALNRLLFLSTLSLRRATCYSLRHSAQDRHFYPRSPCGERPWAVFLCYHYSFISIHALLAESDNGFIPRGQLPTTFLSTLSLRRATARRESRQQPAGISIHALLAESDHTLRQLQSALRDFYPRSPCGERQYLVRGQRPNWGISIHALLAESDGGVLSSYSAKIIFLSTLSLRRATCKINTRGCKKVFLSTLSLRRATQ